MYLRLVIVLLFVSTGAFGQLYNLEYADTKVDASFRGLSVADERAVWVSGSKGWVGRTTDGGEHWSFQQVKGYEQCDFRSLYAFDSNTAVIANAGSPAYVLRTEDGGVTWKELYRNTDSAAFIDGIDMWDDKKYGLIHGDPIKGRMLLLSTSDGGRSWKEIEGPVLMKGEASFAASGTVICCYRDRKAVVATGGKVSKLYFSDNRGKRWRAITTPMLSGSASTGTYSLMSYLRNYWILAGGDYKRDTVSNANLYYTKDNGKTWQTPVKNTRGYRECLAKVYEGPQSKKAIPKTWFAVGPSGMDISTDGGQSWEPLNDEKGFHVMKAAADGKCMFVAGAGGKLARMRRK